MWWPDRRRVLVGAVALATVLAGCGYTPAYGPDGTSAIGRGAVAVEQASDRRTFLLREALIQRLGEPSSPAYALGLEVEVVAEGLGITANNEITRYQLVGTARYTLRDLATGSVATSGQVTGFTGYSTSASTVGGVVARRDAEERLMTILADRIAARLLGFDPGISGG
ncbi:MAG: hypothetical protein D6688_04270 [Alphaproteobacteria bacterium]|nr:MAG: hypothetical protein D6688_04270 [Alphaproteobacteria bacterium]